jgi:hypothetical protein
VVRIGAAGFLPRLIGPVELTEREIRMDLDLELTRGATLEAQLYDAQGQPLAGARLLLAGTGAMSGQRLEEADRELASSDGRGFLLHSGPASDEVGQVRLEHLPTGERLRVWLLQPRYAPTPGPWVILESGRSTSIELRAGPRR